LERAVSEPARVRGVTYEDGLARQIAIDAAGGGGGLPLMEFALTELWAHQHQRRLTFVDYLSLAASPEPSTATPKVSSLSWPNAGWPTKSGESCSPWSAAMRELSRQPGGSWSETVSPEIGPWSKN
jgi:hypothetical protein